MYQVSELTIGLKLQLPISVITNQSSRLLLSPATNTVK